jgi:hypothetical protein
MHYGPNKIMSATLFYYYYIIIFTPRSFLHICSASPRFRLSTTVPDSLRVAAQNASFNSIERYTLMRLSRGLTAIRSVLS